MISTTIAMTALLDLSNKAPRRIGMSRNEYQFRGSLLESSPKLETKAPSPTNSDIFAPPKDSSDEALETSEEDDVRSDSSWSRDGRKRKSPALGRIGKDTALVSPKKEVTGSRGEFWNEPSNIPTSSFLPGSSSGTCNSPKSSQKTIKSVMEDEEEPFGSQSKRARKTYQQKSSQLVSLHHDLQTVKSPRKSAKTASQESQNGKPAFKRPRFGVPLPQGMRPQFNDQIFSDIMQAEELLENVKSQSSKSRHRTRPHHGLGEHRSVHLRTIEKLLKARQRKPSSSPKDCLRRKLHLRNGRQVQFSRAQLCSRERTPRGPQDLRRLQGTLKD